MYDDTSRKLTVVIENEGGPFTWWTRAKAVGQVARLVWRMTRG